MKLNMVHLSGGGSDIVCDDCLQLAKDDRGDAIVTIAYDISVPGDYCVYCGFGDDVTNIVEF